jgi:GNAT superfamily N-acetyltransferase
MIENANTNTVKFVVETARSSQTAAVLTLLPSLLSANSLPTRFIIARCPENPSHILGAAAFIPQIISTQWPGFAMHLNVLANYRRQGIGSALLHQLKVDAQNWNVSHLHVAEHFEDNSPLAQFLSQYHFQPSSNMHYFISQMHATLPMLESLVGALNRRKRVPAGFVLQPLINANLDKAAELFAKEFKTPITHAQNVLQHALSEPMSNEISLALCKNNELAGFLIGKQNNDFPEVSYWVSAPEYRQGWTAALLLEGFVRRANERGIMHGGYSCNDKTTATLNIARKTGAKLTAIKRSYVLNLEAQA